MFEAPKDETEVAWYNKNYVDTVGKISSVMVPYGYSLEMFDKEGFRDDDGSEVINGPYWDHNHRMKCINLWSLGEGYRDWNDKIKSFKVYRTNFGKIAEGTWQAITTTESINYKYFVGMTSTKESSTS